MTAPVPRPDPRDADDLMAVRAGIDAVDTRLVALLAERARWVHRAAAFKSDRDSVRAPARHEAVVHHARDLAARLGTDPDVVEAVYRAMLEAFVAAEQAEHDRINAPPT